MQKVRKVCKGPITGDVELCATKYSDRYIERFMTACANLFLRQFEVLECLNANNEVEFVKYFFPDFDPQNQLAMIGESTSDYTGNKIYFIQLWKNVED